MKRATLVYKRTKYDVTYDVSKVFDGQMIETIDGVSVLELEEDLVNALEAILLDRIDQIFPDENNHDLID